MICMLRYLYIKYCDVDIVIVLLRSKYRDTQRRTIDIAIFLYVARLILRNFFVQQIL